MEGAEGCCRAVPDAQLCTLALVGTGAEAQSQVRENFDFVHGSRAAAALWCQKQ